ncbi:MaoC family dehydratase [Aquibaculum arenosum]|uniref:MaoC family dehydratase n=1 Tax=Aquibaculum arenosum TaxID=3032591 RepID=A0ABT5YRB5_9PROT|nr:MaoC family dehydratase [Fodinicurvata sp. CAU 1616]MDF2097353.1 MaoC family dehydratase [Fodinicurvata sp. CAU 1616]
MDELHGYYFEDLRVGMTDVISRTVTESDIVLFAGVTGDTNPVHLDQAFAEQTMFKGRIAHGVLGAGLISAVFGTKLPGAGCIYVDQNLRFRAPVRIGDTMVARVTLKELIPAKNRAIFDTRCVVGDTVVVEGDATLMVESRPAAQTVAAE